MIISETQGVLRLVRQPDHAIQAGAMARHWGNDLFGALDPSVITAIELHDIGWQAPDDELLYDALKKRPMNFMDVDLRRHVEFYYQGYQKVLTDDIRAGLLVGMHWIGLYTSRFGYDPTFTYNTTPDLGPFMKSNILDQQKAWVDLKMQLWEPTSLKSDFEDQLWMDYETVQLMDRLSLFLAMHTPEDQAEVTLGPVRASRHGERIHVHVLLKGDGTVRFDPFPFQGEFDTAHIVRAIPNQVYPTQQDAAGTVRTAKEESISFRVVRGS